MNMQSIKNEKIRRNNEIYEVIRNKIFVDFIKNLRKIFVKISLIFVKIAILTFTKQLFWLKSTFLSIKVVMIPERKAKMAKIISIVNQKGGTGKSACATNLGVGLAKMNQKVLIIDVDPQADTSCSFGYRDCDDSNETVTNLMEMVLNDEELPKKE